MWRMYCVCLLSVIVVLDLLGQSHVNRITLSTDVHEYYNFPDLLRMRPRPLSRAARTLSAVCYHIQHTPHTSRLSFPPVTHLNEQG